MALVPSNQLPNRSLRVQMRYRPADNHWTVLRVHIVNGRAPAGHDIGPQDAIGEHIAGFYVEVNGPPPDLLSWRRPMTNPLFQRVELPDPARDAYYNLRALPRETVFSLVVPHFLGPPGSSPPILRIYSQPPPQFRDDNQRLFEGAIPIPEAHGVVLGS